MKLAEYLDYIRPSIQMYFKDTVLRLYLVISVFLSPSYVTSICYMRMFGLSEALWELDRDEKQKAIRIS